ncbi:DUF2272 domain-containing protein [Leptolyngbya sp. FACHB-541]|uniref:DUF2272 domain-containing protein n=1 Tax=Leptolyngbya sp. FACHB-541 TaxID=2692810 RepID=UPI0016857EEB|nr:DUF2272 domain-containing protein [Leptolyngbya sp. FACHB-541]MBD1995218.1 DUF2272 domain-containing protein [Leptolyngbya sp. FACHB-541]
MSIWKVNTDSLNLRSSPEKTNDNIIRALPLAQEVKVLTGTPADRWWRVETVVEGASLTGFVSSAFLRQPLSAAKEALISAAVTEWLRFKLGSGLETKDPYYKYIGEYWRALDLPHDGRDTEIYWSAAFISFVARKAGYENFKFSIAHHSYIRDSIEKRISGDTNSSFWGFRLNEHKPQLGDLVCLWRGTPVIFDDLPSEFSSHCDIIVDVRDTEVRALGGNVGDSVSMNTFQLDLDGFLKPTGRVFAILRNNE